MEIELSGRRCGKTTKAIKKAAETGAYMLVLHEQEAKRVVRQAEEMGLKIRHPITFDEFAENRMRGSFVRNVVIDNADYLLQYLLNRGQPLKVEMITLTDETKAPTHA